MLLPLDIGLFHNELIFGLNNPILDNKNEKMILIPEKVRMVYGMVNYILFAVGHIVHKSTINHTFINIVEGKYVKLTPTLDNLNPYNVHYAHIISDIIIEIDHKISNKPIMKSELYKNYRLITTESELIDIINMIYKYDQICAIKLEDSLSKEYDISTLENLIKDLGHGKIIIEKNYNTYLLSLVPRI
jgi:hypothetical protein